MLECAHRGRVHSDSGRCFCRHPGVTGPRRKSTTVPLSRCEVCPVPRGGDLVQLPDGGRAPLPLLTGEPERGRLSGGPGSQLVVLYRERGIPSCQQCYTLAARMDSLGPDGCRERLDEIVADMLPRARAWADQGLITWLAPDVALRTVIRHDVLEAIARAADGGA